MQRRELSLHVCSKHEMLQLRICRHNHDDILNQSSYTNEVINLTYYEVFQYLLF